MIVILGAGVAGLAAAIALCRTGYEVDVRERGDTIGGDLDSAGLVHVNPVGQNAFAELGVGEAVRAAGFGVSAIALRDRDGVEKTRFPARGGDYRYVARSELVAILLDEARRVGANIVTGWEAASVELAGDGATAVSTDGDEVAGEVVIGADGPSSRVREVVDPHGAPADAGHWFVHGSAVRGDVGPTERGVVEMTRDDRTGHAFGRTSVDGELDAWWMRLAGPGPAASVGVLDDDSRTWLAAFVPPGAPGAQLLAATGAPVATYTARTMTVGARWVHGRAALLGDAAHACSPAASWSAALAAEDAVAVATVLASHGPDEGLALFELLRRDRAERAIASGNPRAGIAAGPPYELALGAEVTRESAAAVAAGHRLDQV